MSRLARVFSATVAAVTVLAASGCGSGGDGQIAGIDRGGAPAVASGPISGFGSVIVNGIRFDTSEAIVTIDGQSGSTDDLAVGQIVTVHGTIDDNGNATAAELRHRVSRAGWCDARPPDGGNSMCGAMRR